MNWGRSITLVLILFGAFIIYMVIQFSQKNVDLVAEDYYEQELAYDDMFNAKQNAQNLEQQITVRKQGEFVFVEFPEYFKDKEFNANVHFYKPDNAKGDVKLDTKEQSITINQKELKKGGYEVKVMIQSDETNYFFQEELMIN